MSASLEIQSICFIPSGPHKEKMGVARVAPLPVVFPSNSRGENGFVGSAWKSSTFESKYIELCQRYGQEKVSVVRSIDAEAVRSLLLLSYLTLGDLDASQNHRSVKHFEDIAPSNIALIELNSFFMMDLPYLVSNTIVARNIYPDHANRIYRAYSKVVKDPQYSHFDIELMRTFSNITV